MIPDENGGTSPLPGFLGDLLLRVVASLLTTGSWYALHWIDDYLLWATITLLGTYAWEGVKSLWRQKGDWR
jgi:hypothetical protein